MLPILGLIGTAIGAVSEIGKSWIERKKIKSQGKIEIEKAKVEGTIKRIQTSLEGDVRYDLEAAKGMQFSWKDEFLTILIAAPFVACFIPGLQLYVKQGFEILQADTPEWYQWAFLGIIIASFGLKDWFKNIIGITK